MVIQTQANTCNTKGVIHTHWKVFLFEIKTKYAVFSDLCFQNVNTVVVK